MGSRWCKKAHACTTKPDSGVEKTGTVTTGTQKQRFGRAEFWAECKCTQGSRESWADGCFSRSSSRIKGAGNQRERQRANSERMGRQGRGKSYGSLSRELFLKRQLSGHVEMLLTGYCELDQKKQLQIPSLWVCSYRCPKKNNKEATKSRYTSHVSSWLCGPQSTRERFT